MSRLVEVAGLAAAWMARLQVAWTGMAGWVELLMVRPELLVSVVVAPFRGESPVAEWRSLTKPLSVGYGSFVAQSPFCQLENPNFVTVEDLCLMHLTVWNID